MRKWLKRVLIAVLAMVALLALAVWWLLRGSLPALDGDIALAGLAAPVTIQRDALGVVTIDAANEADALRALGYVHAQERYFEMDLLRRTSAGELSGLFGAIALDLDKRHRVHRMRARVDAHLDAIAGDKLPQLQAYADGVNAGLSALRARPWPYLLLRQQPQPWQPADTALAGYAMYFDLQDAGNTRELALWKLQPHLPEALYALLTHPGSNWDAPLSGEAMGDARLPSADEVDLRKLPAPEQSDREDAEAVAFSSSRERGIGGSPAASVHGVALTPPPAPRAVPLSPAVRERGIGWSPAAGVQSVALTPPPAPLAVPLSPAVRERGIGWSPAATGYFPGSNNFAVSGALTADGRAIVADDMHLGLRAPNLWFRARLRWPDAAAPGGSVDVQGVTLPGLPAVIVGSNGHVAWGYTNSYGDYLDWALETPCAEARADAEGAGHPCTPVETRVELIQVAGAEPVEFEVRETRWGPILHELADGKVLSLRWTAQMPGSVNLGLMDFARVADLDAALALADRTAVPTQNLVIGDSGGNVAWRLLGPLPGRSEGCPTRDLVANATTPAPAPDQGPEPPSQGQPVEPCPPWRIDTAASPVLRSPDAARLWTANSRVVSIEDLARIGDGGYDLGARQRQIRDGLQAKDRFTERDLLAIQLDDRAILMTRWWELLRAQGADDASPALHALAAAASDWQGRASVDSAGYRIVRAWREAVHARLLDGLLAPARASMGEEFAMPWLQQFEGVAWPLLQQRPAHLLPRRFASWDALLEDAAKQVRDELAAQGPLRERTWGELNTAAICHPLAGAVPLGKRLLCMPADPLPGDSMMPRVQGPAFGASERMVVSPGREADGFMHMPGGQSGHPLSPFWGAGHDDWVHGRPTPFLPGPAIHSLTLRP
ncbi:penicillin acylase family protein [Luteimonas marina]|uniref:Penicillin acylase family protein n=1 Tax=Luteimonas marina TaxID=488485 RepID=A0A5C5U6E4_9GAMM|nr:penicillin acylase family protein [Luteimonas marina]TWT21397.1 penicillin acylase family protein [Luteimonas marina]